ncbi:YfiR family protein [Derxia gummosa]|uniref:YfiR family protein n=1 Tax=Derxia gummosa DSM 723 TaxID=1121388 RepID=A0A8B6X8U2_9BURK|nr:YfiR family protein [Derxia gummosa]
MLHALGRTFGAPLRLLLALAFGLASPAQAAGEGEVKAGYLANFAAFTEWPPERAGNGMLRLCLLGASELDHALERIDGRLVNGRPIHLLRLAEPVGLDRCQMLFIGRGARASLPNVLDALAGQPVLTVADSDGFARRGVMINMVLTADRVGFEINRAALAQTGLAVSARLLQLAREVY